MTEDTGFIERMKNVSLGGSLERLTESQKATVEELQRLQKSRDELDSKYNKELNELRAKYEKLYTPLYEQRHKVLISNPPNEPKAIGTPNLPKFWLTAMKNNATLRAIIEYRDEAVLEYLTNVEAEFLEPEKQESFRITMTFAPNPFFTNTSLSKLYNMKVIDGEVEALLQGTEATVIDWLPDKDVTRQTVTKIQRHKRTKEMRTKTEVEDQPSFFRFFTTQQVPSNEALSRMSKQEIAELEMYVEEDYDIGIVIRDKLIPDAIYWYLGIAEDEELEDDEDLDYEDENSSSFGNSDSNHSDSN
ncbi:bifunctional Nucleosome assembly protein (NAP)/NAP-like superfamily [Babesia duncani]|uniref:Bifunctional Nucleosome assembly protein (NAP)/NAP-like superfamily n=1 Tax=Babesia duncani TaxID=323732 RepID=A0AAD9PJV7_9APIC|nr:bifunctional Nucleosome assembly protein (NAP)/NAP-like superfamily [Babesia duncani]